MRVFTSYDPYLLVQFSTRPCLCGYTKPVVGMFCLWERLLRAAGAPRAPQGKGN